MGSSHKLLVFIIPMVATMASVEGTITWFSMSPTGAEVGRGDTSDSWDEAVDNCANAGGVVYDPIAHAAVSEFIKTVMVVDPFSLIYWKRLSASDSDCDQGRFYFYDGDFGDTTDNCNTNAHALCYKCNLPEECPDNDRTASKLTMNMMKYKRERCGRCNTIYFDPDEGFAGNCLQSTSGCVGGENAFWSKPTCRKTCRAPAPTPDFCEDVTNIDCLRYFAWCDSDANEWFCEECPDYFNDQGCADDGFASMDGCEANFP